MNNDMPMAIKRRNEVALANATEVGTRAILKVLGGSCSKTISGQSIDRATASDAIAARINNKIDDALRGLK